MKISDFTTRRADRIELTGDVTLADVVELSRIHVNTLDISQARFGVEEEYWEQVIGYTCPGIAVIGNTGYRKVEVLQRLLQRAVAETVILPDDVQRRHINRIKANQLIQVAQVGPECRLFSNVGKSLYNKKGTREVYNPMEKIVPSDIYEEFLNLYERYTESMDESPEVVNRLQDISEKYCLCDRLFVGDDGKQGLKTCTGDVKIRPIYDSIVAWQTCHMYIDCDIIAVRDGVYYLLSADGKELNHAELIEPIFSVTPARFMRNGKWGLFNSRGQEILPAAYDEISGWNSSYWKLTDGNLVGLLTPFGVIEPQFDSVDTDENDNIIVVRNGQKGYLLSDGTMTDDSEEYILCICEEDE